MSAKNPTYADLIYVKEPNELPDAEHPGSLDFRGMTWEQAREYFESYAHMHGGCSEKYCGHARAQPQETARIRVEAKLIYAGQVVVEGPPQECRDMILWLDKIAEQR